MAMSRRQKGNYYKNKARRFFREQGYDVIEMEIKKTTRSPKTGQLMQIPVDQWAADLAIKNADEIAIVQVRSNAGDVASAKKRFEENGPWPPGLGVWIALYAPGQRGGPTILVRGEDWS